MVNHFTSFSKFRHYLNFISLSKLSTLMGYRNFLLTVKTFYEKSYFKILSLNSKISTFYLTKYQNVYK